MPLQHSQDLLVIDTQDVMDTQVAETVRKIVTLGVNNILHLWQKGCKQCTTCYGKIYDEQIAIIE